MPPFTPAFFLCCIASEVVLASHCRHSKS